MPRDKWKDGRQELRWKASQKGVVLEGQPERSCVGRPARKGLCWKASQKGVVLEGHQKGVVLEGQPEKRLCWKTLWRFTATNNDLINS